jgi:hypothetical protein
LALLFKKQRPLSISLLANLKRSILTGTIYPNIAFLVGTIFFSYVYKIDGRAGPEAQVVENACLASMKS